MFRDSIIDVDFRTSTIRNAQSQCWVCRVGLTLFSLSKQCNSHEVRLQFKLTSVLESRRGPALTSGVGVRLGLGWGFGPCKKIDRAKVMMAQCTASTKGRGGVDALHGGVMQVSGGHRIKAPCGGLEFLTIAKHGCGGVSRVWVRVTVTVWSRVRAMMPSWSKQ